MAVGFTLTEEQRRRIFRNRYTAPGPSVESLMRELLTLVRFMPVWTLHDAAEILMDEDAWRRARQLIRDNHNLYRAINQDHQNGYVHAIPAAMRAAAEPQQPPQPPAPEQRPAGPPLPPLLPSSLSQNLPSHQTFQQALHEHMHDPLRLHLTHYRRLQQQQQPENVQAQQQREQRRRRERDEDEMRRLRDLPDCVPEHDRHVLMHESSPRVQPRVRAGNNNNNNNRRTVSTILTIKVELCNFCWEDGHRVKVVGMSRWMPENDANEAANAAIPAPLPQVVAEIIQPVNNVEVAVTEPVVQVEHGSPVKRRLLSLFIPNNIETSVLTAAFVIVGWKMFISQ